MKKIIEKKKKSVFGLEGLISLYFHLHQVLSDQPGLELYTGNFLPAEVASYT